MRSHIAISGECEVDEERNKLQNHAEKGEEKGHRQSLHWFDSTKRIGHASRNIGDPVLVSALPE
jgi:hypothetical protein